MKLTTILSILLLVFVGGSLVYLFAKESGGKPKDVIISSTQDTSKNPDSVITPGGKVPESKAKDGSDGTQPAETKPVLQPDRVIAYYFHGNKRCANCIKIENWSREAIQAAFPVALSDGTLEWKVVNTDEPENEHFVKDYKLTNKSVVLVRLVKGKQADWKNSQGVWMHLNNQDEFMSYVKTEVRTFLSGG